MDTIHIIKPVYYNQNGKSVHMCVTNLKDRTVKYIQLSTEQEDFSEIQIFSTENLEESSRDEIIKVTQNLVCEICSLDYHDSLFQDNQVTYNYDDKKGLGHVHCEIIFDDCLYSLGFSVVKYESVPIDFENTIEPGIDIKPFVITTEVYDIEWDYNGHKPLCDYPSSITTTLLVKPEKYLAYTKGMTITEIREKIIRDHIMNFLETEFEVCVTDFRCRFSI